MYLLRPGKSLVLASASPRRRDLLGRMGLEFVVRPAEVDESLAAGESAADSAMRLAEAKARAVTRQPGQAVLAADTLVAVGEGRGEAVLGKPADRDEALAMLGLLSGVEHRVVTGFCLIDDAGQARGLAESRVRFRRLAPAEIAAYAATGEPMGKAGAYAIQERGAALVEGVSGSYTNVVGLPLAAVIELLLSRGIIEPAAGGA